MKRDNKEHLKWIYEKMIREHGEYRYCGYMEKFKEIIDDLEVEALIESGTKVIIEKTSQIIEWAGDHRLYALNQVFKREDGVYRVVGLKYDNTLDLYTVSVQLLDNYRGYVAEDI